MSEHHIRAISTTLALLDKALCEFDQWANGHEIRSDLYQVLNALSEDQRKAIAAEVAEMRTVLHEMKTTLNLEVSARSVEKTIVGSCSVLWASLVELEGRCLSRYGEVPPGLAEYLGPRIASLNKSLRRLSATVAGPQSP